jgi:hypothetical protein
MDLQDLNQKFGTDKGGKHCYLEQYYQKKFEPIKDSTKKVFEIGVYEGASIRLWKEYFKNAEIYALEVLSKRRGMFEGEERINLVIGDSVKKSSYTNLPLDFDIIIDDGSHRPEDQFETFKLANLHLRQGGLYIIEDVRDVSKLRALLDAESINYSVYDFSDQAEPDTVIFEISK